MVDQRFRDTTFLLNLRLPSDSSTLSPVLYLYIMDPLSVTASVIALAGTFGRISMTLREIMSATKNAPSDVLVLSNEISDLTLLLSQIEPLRSRARISHSLGITQADTSLQLLSIQLQKAAEATEGIDNLIGSFVPNPGNEGNVKSAVTNRYSRYNFIRNRSRIIELRRQLTNIKHSLALILSSLNL